LPIPEDLPLVLGGVIAHRGGADLTLIFLTCYCGIVLGDVIIFLVGKHFGPALFKKKWFKNRVPLKRIRKIRVTLERRSLLTILIARHLFYLRTVTFLTCGAINMRFIKFLIADAVAALISAPVMLGIGYICSENYEIAIEKFEQAKTATICVGIIITAAYFIYKKYKSNNSRVSEHSPNPGTEADL